MPPPRPEDLRVSYRRVHNSLKGLYDFDINLRCDAPAAYSG
jgi:hypothetical protein